MRPEDALEDPGYTSTLVEKEWVSRRTMAEKGVWSIEESLDYQPVAEIVEKTPVMRQGRIIAWRVTYHYDPKETNGS